MDCQDARLRYALLRRSMRECDKVCILMAAILAALFMIAGLIARASTGYGVGTVLLFAALSAVLVAGILWLACFLGGPLSGLIRLRRQEKLLGRRLAEEAPEGEANRLWYVACERGTFLAFRRGYLRKIGKLRPLYARGLPRAGFYAIDRTGRRIWIAGGYQETKLLRDWAMGHGAAEKKDERQQKRATA